MVTLIGPLAFHEEIKIKRLNLNNNRYTRHALKHKHTLKHKCKKLYKYRLRKNGEEDPDVVDVSHILLSTLKIKSPSKILQSPEKITETDELRPKNYLFKMARRRHKVKPEAPIVATTNDIEGEAYTSSENESKKKAKTNAFQLLMDSRNKSIGTNSPGKEKVFDSSQVLELKEKKTLKVKRNLALQKMAEAKGSLKKKELEELQEKCVQRKMEKRAERLKNIIKMKDTSQEKSSKDIKATSSKKKVIEIENKPQSNENNARSKNKISKSLQLVDIFKDVISPENKLIPKEDEEFLNKLSPSIRKKENMLCYFKKIEKKITVEDVEVEVDSNPAIKVNFVNKNKLRKKRLSLNKNPTSEVLKDHNEKSSCNSNTDSQEHTSNNLEHREESSNKRKKRKRKENLGKVVMEIANVEIVNSNEIKTEDNGRPKRNIKRPVKYVDDAQVFSSDEELHIFTPRKRKCCEKVSFCTKEQPVEIVVSDDDSKKKISVIRKNLVKDEKVEKKATKLAPLFAPKPQLKPEQWEAKQKFLYSGVPDQIKKIVLQQKTLQSGATNEFPVVVHIQQKETTKFSTQSKMLPYPLDNNSDDEYIYDDNKSTFRKLLALHESNNINIVVPSVKNNVAEVLQTIKEQYPKFPVYRTFRFLKTKSKGEFKENNIPDLRDNSSEIINIVDDFVNENPEYLNWTNKYQSSSSKHLIGNFESIKELKKWLQSWTELDMNSKTRKLNNSDSSDFYDSDSNSKDSFKNNLLIVSGPVGCGKTSSVYAVAAELAIKVIEVNASSKRTGKMMLQDLQEATQSHKVNRCGSDMSQKSQEMVETVTTIVSKKRGRPKKSESLLKKANSKDEILTQSTPSASQDNTRTVMSLILVDDADIVFDQDDGFCSAISQLIQFSKRPVILVTNSLTCTHLQRFLHYGKVINMNPLSPKILGTWLDIMCLANGKCWPGLGTKFLEYFKGDIRKSINCLQFYITAYSRDCMKDDEASYDFNKFSPDNENSNMSWPENEGLERKIVVQPTNGDNDVWKYFMYKEINLFNLKYPKDLFNVWWNVPSLLNNVFNDKYKKKTISGDKEQNKEEMVQQLEEIANVMDSLSLSDYISCKKPDTSCDLTSTPWHTSEMDSVSELEHLECYNNHHIVTSNVIQELIASSIGKAQETLQCEKEIFIDFPSMKEHRDKNRLTSRHNEFTHILNPSAVLDRKALALDYWSNCRSICRIEKNKTDMISKRNNRYCHYLKSMNVMCRSDTFDSLGDSLSFKGKVD